MTHPDPQEEWQTLPRPPPRCPVCCHAMPTPAHVFLHQQQHAEPRGGLPLTTLNYVALDLFDRIARLMQDYHESHHP